MKHLTLLFTTFLLIISLPSISFCQQNRPSQLADDTSLKANFPEYSQENLLEDLEYFEKELKTTHPNLYLFVSEQNHDNYLNEARKKIDRDMTEIEFLRILSSVAEKVGCGHLGVSPSDSYQQAAMMNLKLLPFLVKIIDNKVYISEIYLQGHENKSGAELIGIDGVDIDQIINTIADGLCTDKRNRSSKTRIIESSFPVVYANHIGFSDKYELEIKENGKNDTDQLVVEGMGYNELFGNFLRNHPEESPAIFPLILKFDDENKTALLRVKAFESSDWKKYLSATDSIFAQIKNHGSKYLILDLRVNMGGRPPLSNAVLSYIAKNDYIYFVDKPVLRENYPLLVDVSHPAENAFKGEVFILMNGGCKSSTGHFISLAKYFKWATLIGTETGASHYCNDGSLKLLLPNTRAHYNLPTREVMTHVDGFDKKEPIKPDVEIHTTYNDLISGTDPVMAYTKNYIRNMKKD